MRMVMRSLKNPCLTGFPRLCDVNLSCIIVAWSGSSAFLFSNTWEDNLKNINRISYFKSRNLHVESLMGLLVLRTSEILYSDSFFRTLYYIISRVFFSFVGFARWNGRIVNLSYYYKLDSLHLFVLHTFDKFVVITLKHISLSFLSSSSLIA